MKTAPDQRPPDRAQRKSGRPPWEPGSRLWLAWAAVAWERLWPRLWPAVALTLTVLALVLLDVLASPGPWPQAVVLTLALAGLVWLLWTAFSAMDWPGLHDARARLERDSGFDHRPLTALDDRQASGITDPGSRLLWNAHLRQVRSAVTQWSVRAPRPGLAAQDRFGLRIAVGLLLVIAVTVGGRHWEDRVSRNLIPDFADTAAMAPVRLDVSVSPPDYTGEPPLYLLAERPANGGPPAAPTRTVLIPAGSTVLARVSAGSATPTLSIGGDRFTFDDVPDAGYEIERTIVSGSNITVSQGADTLGVWSIRVIPDTPPRIDFTEPPRGTERNSLRLSFEAEDDYGIEDVTAVLRLELDAASALDREPMELDLPHSDRASSRAEGISFHDLTAHPWAGEAVRIRLAATDSAGQIGQSSQMLVRLPERTFSHPIAAAVIDQRRILIREHQRSAEVAESLDNISVQVDRYDGDTVVFLALRTAARRLFFANGAPSAVEPVAQLLWDTALRLEDGDLSLIERELRAAQDALRRALATDAPEDQIAELNDRLEAALERYLDALARDVAANMQQSGTDPQGDPRSMPNSAFGRDDFSEMMVQLRGLGESGARDEANQLLSRLQDMLESLQSGQAAAAQNQAMEVLTSLMDEMQSLIADQQSLFDNTHNLDGDRPADSGPLAAPNLFGPVDPFGGGGGPGSSDGPGDQSSGAAPSPDEIASLAQRQNEIRRALGELMRQIGDFTGDIPGEFGSAEQSMRRSESALESGDVQGSLPGQEDAMDQMGQGAESFVDAIMDRMAGGEQGGATIPGGGAAGGFGAGRDPLGRPVDGRGSHADDDIELPTADALGRVRAILDELRGRVGDQSRPALERDYLDRLLERF